MGISLLAQSNAVFEQVIVYDSTSSSEITASTPAQCNIKYQNEGYTAIKANKPKSCQATFTLDRDLPVNTGPSLYYQVTNFYQNHRRYVKSRSDLQLQGVFQAPGSGLSTACDPNASYVAPEGPVYYPCGLIATSYFNDNFKIGSAPAGVTLNEKGIAWSIDMKSHFKNPTGQGLNDFKTFRYLWQTYSQMSCYNQSAPFNRVQCQTWGDLVPGAFGECAKCPPGSTPVGEGGIPPPGGWENFSVNDTVGNATSTFGVRDEHFVVWMRTAGLPTFRKLYGTLTPPTGGQFKKGDQITINIIPNFEVQTFGGTKALVLSTSTPVGGKSNVMGIAYLVVGILSAALAVAFTLKLMIAPRKLGDTSYIAKRHKA